MGSWHFAVLLWRGCGWELWHAVCVCWEVRTGFSPLGWWLCILNLFSNGFCFETVKLAVCFLQDLFLVKTWVISPIDSGHQGWDVSLLVAGTRANLQLLVEALGWGEQFLLAPAPIKCGETYLHWDARMRSPDPPASKPYPLWGGWAPNKGLAG